MLAPLDNQVVFKKAFTDKIVFESFVKDLFNIDISVDKIETEKKFFPKASHIDIAIDIYAETSDHRFIIEIQKIDYDANFDRFLDYFITTITDQQKASDKYQIKQQVLGVVVLCSPYKLDQKDGQPIKDSVLSIDFNPRNLKGEKVHLWDHNLVYLNPHPKYRDSDIPQNYQDWLDLLYVSMESKPGEKITLNLNHRGISRVTQLIDYEKIDSKTLTEMKQASGRRAVAILEHRAGFLEGIDYGRVLLKKEKERTEKAERKVKEEKERAEEAERKVKEEKERAEKAERKVKEEKERAEKAERKSKEEKEQAIAKAIQKGNMTLEEIAELFDVPEDYIHKKMTR
jgi:hypothetical protein